MAIYRVDLEDDNFEIITADSNKEAISEALDTYFETVFNVVLLDDDYNEIETIF